MLLQSTHLYRKRSPMYFRTCQARAGRALAAMLMLAFAGPGRAADGDNIATDRPDFVESSEVVGKGRLQVETSFARERSASVHTTSTPTLLRAGVSDTLELRFESDGRVHERSDGADARGYADASIGVKWHAADASGYAPSLGILLHADLPSGSAWLRGSGVRPSLRVAGEWELPADMSVGVMPGISYETDDSGRRFANGIFGVVLGKELTPRWRAFVELSSPQIASARHGGSQASVDAGASFQVNAGLQLDFAIARGLNKRTPDASWTVGLSFRL